MLAGIIAPTQIEADLIIKQLFQKEEDSIQEKFFYKGILGRTTEFIICICGVGKANAAHGTAILIEKFKPDLIYIIGVAGAYPSSRLKIGDVVIAEKEIYGDEGLIAKTEVRRQKSGVRSQESEVRSQKSGVREKYETNFYTMDKINIPLCITDGVKYYNEFPMFIPEKLRSFKNKGNFVTVSTCTGILERGIEIEKRFNAICENMEGAAIAHVCTFSEIPAIEIRGISNFIEDRAAEPLNKANIIKAAESAQTFFLERLI
jgi:futalosine hydrolase